MYCHTYLGTHGLENSHTKLHLPTHQHFTGDTQILQDSPAHLRRIVTRIWLSIDHFHWSSQPLQGVVTYTSPDEVFATVIKFFDRQKSVFGHFIVPFWGPDRLSFRGQNQIAAACFWSFDFFSSSEVTLIPWSAPKRPQDIIFSHVQYSLYFHTSPS